MQAQFALHCIQRNSRKTRKRTIGGMLRRLFHDVQEMPRPGKQVQLQILGRKLGLVLGNPRGKLQHESNMVLGLLVVAGLAIDTVFAHPIAQI